MLDAKKDEIFRKRIAEYYKFTCYLAYKHSQNFFSTKSSFSKNDLQSEALLALCVAAKSFDLSDESKFRSYLAATVANRIKRHLTESSSPVTLKYSTQCYYKNRDQEQEDEPTAKRIKAVSERNAYCEENVEQHSLIDDYYRKESDPELHLERVMRAKKLRRAISNISDESKKIIKAVYYDDTPAYDLAEQMNYSPMTIYAKKKIAHKEIRKQLVNAFN